MEMAFYGKRTELVLTGGFGDLALFCKFRYLLEGRLVFEKGKNTIRLIFNQSNWEGVDYKPQW
jgi:hypothetical protein